MALREYSDERKWRWLVWEVWAQRRDSALWAGRRHLVLSKTTSGNRTTLKEATAVFEVDSNGVSVTVTGTQADGRQMGFSFTARFDDEYYPVTGPTAGPPGNSIRVRRLDARTLESMSKADGQILFASTYSLSKEGNTVTVTLRGPGGQPGGVDVWEK